MNFSFLAEGQARWIAIGAVLAAFLLALIWWLQKPPRRIHHNSGRVLDAVDTVIGWPPEVSRVLTHRHRRAYEVLHRALPEHVILAQVPVARFIRVPARLSYAEWLRRVGHVCVDLLVCDRSSHVVAVVEVRETGRRPSDRARKREGRLERVLSAAKVPLQVWDEAWMPDPATVRRTLLTEPDAQLDAGVSTIPMGLVPEALEISELGDPDLSGFGPPRTTWFDEVHATEAAPLDTPSEPSPMPAKAGFPLSPAASAVPR